MNNKTYANYLMHGRTKGSRNGISTTKGYTAVGQKAKGKLINGKYVYEGPRDGYQYINGTYAKDDPAAVYDVPREKRVEGLSNGKYWYETPELPEGVAAYPKLTTTWNKAYADANHVSTYPQGGWDAEMLRKRNAWLAEKAKAQGASNNWQQQAALEQWKKQNQNAIAAKKTADAKAQAAKDAAWNAKVQTAKKPTNIGASQAGNTARAMKEYMTKASADRKAQTQSAKQPTNIGASQSADLARWKQQNRNNIAASKKAAKQQELIKKADASYDAYQKSVAGSRNNWQNQAAKESSFGRAMNKYNSDQSKELPNFGEANPGSNEYWAQEQARLKRVTRDQDRNSYSVTTETKPYISKAAVDAAKLAKQGTTSFYTAPVTQHDLWEATQRNSRSDIGNALADAKEDAKNAFKALKNKFKNKKKK